MNHVITRFLSSIPKTPISNIDQLIEKFNQTYDRTDQQIRSAYGDEQFRDGFIGHLKKMIVLTRTNIDEVSQFRTFID